MCYQKCAYWHKPLMLTDAIRAEIMCNGPYLDSNLLLDKQPGIYVLF